MKKFLLAFFALIYITFNSTNVSASHVAGADWSYTCLGGDTFLITMNVFRDCSGMAFATTQDVTFYSPCGDINHTWTADTVLEVSQLCPSALISSTCNGGNLPGMEQYIFTDTIVLPACASGPYDFFWELSARNGANNFPAFNFVIDAMLNTQATPCNNSPQFYSQPIPYVCANQQVVYNFGVTEPDGDSLVFSLGDPYVNYDNASNTWTLGAWTPPYTTTNPFDVPVSLNPVTGELTFTPVTQGNWLIKVCIDEYRNGVNIGRVCRDIQFIVQTCENNQPYMISPGITNFNGSGIQADSATVEVCPGDSFSFDIYFSDSLWTQTSPSQTFGDSVTLTSNIQAQLPGAIVNYVFGDTAMIHVEWMVPATGYNPQYIFVVNATDDACNVSGLSSTTFMIKISDGTVGGVDQILCRGVDTANMAPSGGSYFEWSVISGDPLILSGPNQNFSDTTGTNGGNVWAFPQHTTLYEVTSNMSPFCKTKDTIQVTVVRNFDLDVFGDTAVCPNDSLYTFLIGAEPDTGTGGPAFNFSYEWTDPSYLDYDTIRTPTATNVTATETFYVTATSDSGCVKSNELRIDFAPDFPTDLTVGFVDTLLCLGDTTTAYIDFGEVIGPNCGLAPSPCNNTPDIGYSGTGTSTNTTISYPAPYGNFYWGAKHQILYTAAELQAMGMTNGGKISSLAFDVASTNSSPALVNYTIKMGCTSSSDLSSAWETGLTTVFGPTTHTPTTGWNVHNFATPYNWDGTSNLVVEICFNNSSYISNASTYYSTTSFTSVRYYRADNSNVCSNTTTATTSSNRPNTQFEFCTGYDPAAFTYAWNPNADISDTSIIDPFVYPSADQSYTVIVHDTFGACLDTASRTVEVVTSYDASFSYNTPLCLNGGVDTAVPVLTGGVWAGTGVVDSLNGLFDPFLADTGMHDVTYTMTSPAGNCSSTDTFSVQVIPLPDAGYSGPTQFCSTGGPYTLIPNTPGGVWSGPGITDPANGIWDPAGSGLQGSYNVYYTLTVPCTNTDTITLVAHPAYDFDFNNIEPEVCLNDTLVLFGNYTLTNGNLSIPTVESWSGLNITNSDSGYYIPSTSGVDTVYLTVTDTNGGCAGTNPLGIRVLPIDTPQIFGNLQYCDDQSSAVISIDKGWNPSNVTYSFMPITGSGNITVDQLGRFSPSAVGAGTWELNYSFTNLNGCTGYLIDTIEVLRTPVEPTVTSDIFCVGEDVILSATGSEPDTVFWYDTPGAGSRIGSGTPYFWNTASNDDVINVKTVYVKAENGQCHSDLVSYNIPVVPAPDVTIARSYLDSNDQNTTTYDPSERISGESPFTVEFIADGANVPPDSVYWNFWVNGTPADGSFGWPAISDNGDRPSEAYTYEKEGDYLVMLVTTNEYGCSDTTYAQHEVIFAAEPPNVFSPNGDGVNDIFYIPGALALRNFHCSIYNRWGRLVYEWSNPAEGWDGSGSNDGVYFYIVTGSRADGSDYKRQGNVTITSGK